MDQAEIGDWVGRSDERTDWITPARVAAWNATFDHESGLPAEGDPAPLGFHWTLSPPLARESELGVDGHARTGGFLPPVPLPRRMWAGSRVVFHQPLTVGERVERQSVIAAVREKRSDNGRLVFVTVRHQLTGNAEWRSRRTRTSSIAKRPSQARQPRQKPLRPRAQACGSARLSRPRPSSSVIQR